MNAFGNRFWFGYASMSNLLDYFDAAYLINLPERKDRLRSATKEFTRAGWPIGPDAVQVYPAQRLTDAAGFPGGPSVRSCFESHLACLSAAYELGKKSVLIMEDDIGLAPSIPRLAAAIAAQLDAAPWDFVYLGHGHTGDIPEANAVTATVAFAPATGDIGGAHFYAVNRRILERLIAFLTRLRDGGDGDEHKPMPLDGAYNVFRRTNTDVRTVLAVPKLGWQRPSRSDISPRPIDKIKPLQPLLNLLRNFKDAVGRWRG
jgi:glycosyl transferase, family 25